MCRKGASFKGIKIIEGGMMKINIGKQMWWAAVRENGQISHIDPLKSEIKEWIEEMEVMTPEFKYYCRAVWVSGRKTKGEATP